MTFQNLEASAMSRSIKSEASVMQNKLLSGHMSTIDAIFPFVDQMTQFSQIPPTISFIFSLYASLQILFVSLFTSSNYWIFGKKSVCNIIDYISKIFFFVSIKLPYQKNSDLDDIDIEIQNDFDDGYLTKILIVIAVVFALVLASLLFHYFYDLIHHRFLEGMLLVTRILVEDVAQVMILPSASFTGASLLMVCRGKGNVYWIYFIVGIIFFICFILFYACEILLVSKSVIVNPNPMAAFSIRYYLEALSINSIIIIITYLFQSLSSWTDDICPIIHLIGSVFVLIPIIRFLPYYFHLSNTLYQSIYTAGSFSDLFFFVFFLIDKNHKNQLVPFIFIFIAFVISFIVYFIINRLYFKKIEKIMDNRTFLDPFNQETNESTEENEGTSLQSNFRDDDYVSYYNNFGLENAPNKSLTFLQVSFAKNFYHFYDWSLLKYLFTTMPSNQVLIACIQFVSYFPSESRMTNELFKQLLKKNDLKFEQRFLLYQVNKIKRSRASSSSVEANEHLSNLKSLSDECFSNICAFYSQPDVECSIVETISQKKKKIKSLWLEALRNHPNSIKIHEEYIKFVTECETDFHNAIIAQQRIEMIENGYNFAIDNSFKSMVQTFPQYLKKGIVDVTGKINLDTKASDKPIAASGVDMNEMSRMSLKSEGSQSSTSTSSSLNLSLTDNDQEIDNEIESDFGRRMFRQSKLRIALFHSLEDRKFFGETTIPLFATLSLVITIVLFIVFFIVVTSDYSKRKDEIDMLSFTSQTRFHLTLSITILTFAMAQNTDRMINISDIYNFSADNLDFDMFIDFNRPLNAQALQFIDEAIQDFHKISYHISTLSKKDVSPYTSMEQFVHDVANFSTCYNGTQMNTTVLMNINNIYAHLFHLVQALSARNDYEKWYTDDDFCHLEVNSDQSAPQVDALFNNICKYQIEQGDKLSKQSNIFKIAIPIIIFVFAFIPLCANSLVYVSHINKFIEAYQDIDKEGKAEITKPILKSTEEVEHSASSLSGGLTKMVSFNIILFILSLAVALMFFFMIFMLDNGSKEITQIVRWELYSSTIFSKSLEALHLVAHIIFLNDTQANISSYSNFTNRAIKLKNLQNILTQMKSNYLAFYSGTDESDPVAGFDSTLDSFAIKEECILPDSINDFHDTYRCESAQKMYSSFINLIQPILIDPLKYQGIIQGNEPSHLIELMNRHFLYKLNKIVQRFEELIGIQNSKMNSEAIIFLFFGCLIAVVQFIFCFVIRRFTMETFYTVLALGRRIPPHQIVSSRKMKITFLCQSDTETELDITSISQNILHNSKDAVIITTENLIIEVVNPAITDILGFTPDQLLGQSISIVFREKDGESLIKEMESMKEGQNPTIYENHYNCVSDSMNEIPCLVTALGMKNDNTINSFVFILRDETEITRQQQEAEKAKAVSENLLYQILPRDIVFKLNRGEKDISFTVKSASIIFIDIVKFSEYTTNLTPSEIMGNLSIVFASFDKFMKKYPLIIKIKLIGDDYMAASGLFETEDNPKEHATQSMHFCLDCISGLEEVNIKLNANLQVRCGMNTSGPLIAGVLGTNKPVFDIIGDPINVAARLQTTDVPGKVQITQNTYEYLPTQELNIEPRGEVFLKGKGKAMTYLVSPGMSIFSITATSKET